jgi:hypothetical protein
MPDTSAGLFEFAVLYLGLNKLRAIVVFNYAKDSPA